MNFAFRVDASVQIGTGHVMRCLTLASALQRKGHECIFISRASSGNLASLILGNGFQLYELSCDLKEVETETSFDWNEHAQWLGVHWQLDAEQTFNVLESYRPDWLIVDHYSLDAQWENQVAEYSSRVMVIDDLADRDHCCDLLLDQTFGRETDDYKNRVPEHCQVLCGATYALLRPEFASLRSYSLKRRANPVMRQLIISMGGVDEDNATGKVLDALQLTPLGKECKIIVVMGETSPWLQSVKSQARAMPWSVDVKVGVTNMAQLMADSDYAIGAAGATSWERCCLGLPTLMIVIAENQKTIAKAIGDVGAAKVVDLEKVCRELPTLEDIINPPLMNAMVNAAKDVCDGAGTARVVDKLIQG